MLISLATIAPIIASLNLAYGNCDPDGTRFAYAPNHLTIGNTWKSASRLTADDYASQNWWPVTDIAPSVTDSEIAIASGWTKTAHDNTRNEVAYEETGTLDADGLPIFKAVTNIVHFTTYTIARTYTITQKPTPAKSYDINRIVWWLVSHAKMESVTAFLKSQSLYEAFLTAQTIDADNESFDEVKRIVVSEGIATTAEVAECLEYAEVK